MADIPLPQSNSDIYSLGFDKGLNRPIADNSTGVVYDTIGNSLNTGSVLSGGNLNLKTLSIGGLVKQVAPGDDIQAAIDAVNRDGGGTVQLVAGTYALTREIALKSNVKIAGAGVGVTVLDFEGRGLNLRGSSISNVGLLNFSVVNSGSSDAGINISTLSDSFFQNVEVDMSTVAAGFRFVNCSNSNFVGLVARDNATSGFRIEGDGSLSVQTCTFLNCISESNNNLGYYVFNIADIRLISCLATNNGTSGADDGFRVLSTSQYAQVIGCYSSSNLGAGFRVSGATGLFVGNYSFANGINWILDDSEDSLLVGNYFSPTGGFSSSNVSLTNEPMTIYGNIGSSPVTEQRSYLMRNTSGGALPDGAVVVIKATANGEEVSTTTTNGDNKVFGMAYSVGSNGYNNVLAQGKTTLALVNNSSSSISIGDWLSTYSHAYYAKKAVAGETVFAMALEAPTTSTAAISALLVSPRLI